MKARTLSLLAAGLALPLVALSGKLRRRQAKFAGVGRGSVQRVGMVIGIHPDRIVAYEALHAASNPGVRDLLTKYHMRNFSIFLHRLYDGRYCLFGYYEYTGKDYAADLERLAIEPRNREWLSTTDPMQIPLPGERSWARMREVYHN